MISSTGRARSIAGFAPPSMNTSVAAFAPISAPEVAESTMSMPFAARPFAVSTVIHGSHDDVSITSSPPSKPSTRPSLPSATSRTYSPDGSIVTTISERSATSRGVAATCIVLKPAASRSAFARSTSSTVSKCPAFARCPAIGVPITPSPMKPMRIAMMSSTPGRDETRRENHKRCGALAMAGFRE